MPVNSVFRQIVVPQACPERPDPSTGPPGGVEIWALCEWRLAIDGVGAARLVLVVGVDAMSTTGFHATSMVGRRHGKAWHADRHPSISGTMVFYNSSDLIT